MLNFQNLLPNSVLGFKLIQDDHVQYEGHVSSAQKVLLGSLLTEFLNSTLWTSAITSMVTAKAAGRPLRFVGPATAYISPDPLIFPAVASWLTAPIKHPFMVGSLHTYYLRLAFARVLTQMPEADWQPGADVKMENWRQLSDVWRRTCALASIAIHYWYDTISTLDVDVKSRLNAAHLLIMSAKNGETPCVRSDGLVFVPGYMDERRQERRMVGCKILLEAAGFCGSATLQDISIGGMGLAFCPAFAVGAQVSAQLNTGRRLVGIVTWSRGNRAGAKFLQPLHPSDPLLKDFADGTAPLPMSAPA